MNLRFLTQRRGGCPTLVVAVWRAQISFAQIDAVAYAQSEALQPQKLTKTQQLVKLEQMDQRWREAQSARDKGDFPTAIKAADDVLAIVKALLGDNHKALIGLLEFLAQCHEASANFAKAKQVRDGCSSPRWGLPTGAVSPPFVCWTTSATSSWLARVREAVGPV